MKKILLALSGGIDSLLAARLLQKEGKEVKALHFLTGFEEKEKEGEIRKLAEQLGCSLEIVDISKIFYKEVIENFADLYKKGLTPNPCLRCNAYIKFGLLPRMAEKLSCEGIATGHYVKLLDGENGEKGLFKGRDERKDQSYFLAFIDRKILPCLCFPLGDLKKEEVKKIAEREGLKALLEKESQDICFLPDGNYADFLEEKFNIKKEPGPIITREGKVIGEHRGLHRYTIGQRRGLNCPGPRPYHVLEIDMENNRLIAGFSEDLLSKGACLDQLNWLIKAPEKPLELKVKIRYSQREVKALLLPLDKQKAKLEFKEAQRAVSPGQGAVFYMEDQLLGGGRIVKAIP